MSLLKWILKLKGMSGGRKGPINPSNAYADVIGSIWFLLWGNYGSDVVGAMIGLKAIPSDTTGFYSGVSPLGIGFSDPSYGEGASYGALKGAIDLDDPAYTSGGGYANR